MRLKIQDVMRRILRFETFQMEIDAAILNKANNLESYFDRCKNGYVYPNGTDLQWSHCKEKRYPKSTSRCLIEVGNEPDLNPYQQGGKIQR